MDQYEACSHKNYFTNLSELSDLSCVMQLQASFRLSISKKLIQIH